MAARSLRWEPAAVADSQWSGTGIAAWWTLLLSALRDVAALGVGVWILVVRVDAPPTLQGIGYLLLTASATGAARTAIRAYRAAGEDGPSSSSDG